MTEEEYISLYEKYMQGNCTPQEEKLLLEYRDGFQLLDLPWDKDISTDEETTKQSIYKKLRYSIYTHETRYLHRIKQWSAAAILILGLSAGLYSWNRWANKETFTEAQAHLKNDIPPGGNKAVLTLADGSTIVLDQAENGVLANQGNIAINKAQDGQLLYVQTNAIANSGQKLLMNRVSTPRGGQYQLTLPDGTKVWLNAASSLRFPANFQGLERRVELTGEAYFEVAKNKQMPFRVTVNDMAVEVLGTHFNVMSYEDESAIETTLLEGSVKVMKDDSEKIIQPGQKAVLDRSGGNIRVLKANMEEAVAWKNGYFMFNNEPVHSVMRQISRWYDVDVSYEGDMTGKSFGGTVSRFEQVSEVLKTMELTGIVHFKLVEGRIIVMP